MARTYNESLSVMLCGPIEYWWSTPEDPNRFLSADARDYREHRDAVRDWFVKNHYLVYSPHSAFKGPWNEKMQPVNDYVLGLCDIVVNLTPGYLEMGSGTAHEVELALNLGKPVLWIPSGLYIEVLPKALDIIREKYDL